MTTEWSMRRAAQGKVAYSVGTGGGPGMMEAANKGAMLAGGKSIGFGISLPFEDHLNPYVTPDLAFEFHYFFTRKFWMSYKCMGLVVAPGGLGTCDELFEVITLMQTGKIRRSLPVILIGKQFWKSAINWDFFVQTGMISDEDANQLIFADTAQEGPSTPSSPGSRRWSARPWPPRRRRRRRRRGRSQPAGATIGVDRPDMEEAPPAQRPRAASHGSSTRARLGRLALGGPSRRPRSGRGSSWQCSGGSGEQHEAPRVPPRVQAASFSGLPQPAPPRRLGLFFYAQRWSLFFLLGASFHPSSSPSSRLRPSSAATTTTSSFFLRAGPQLRAPNLRRRRSDSVGSRGRPVTGRAMHLARPRAPVMTA
ncbi:unnamed protein product [Prorocentrum cordatum]|uniref:Cytokinin riboside 5'-monophosphate phosphoribohydrolase n=1 Tax=Prorocentrum cordatum TaxID=2364126 RepID=A0ABN9X0B8_9DINO|nr:unnamed protein product [Polarella glacialis]